MFKDFLDKIKSIFKAEKSPTNVTVSFENQSKNVKKQKKLKNSVDNSDDHSTTINGNVDKSVHETNYYSANEGVTQNADLIISARWLNLVPRKIQRVNDGFDCFSVLMPTEKDYISPSINIDLDKKSNKDHAIHILVKNNPFIKNLKLYSISIDGENCKTNHIANRDIFGLLDEDRSFAVNGEKYIECSAQITIVLKFEKDRCEYSQEFEFTAQRKGSKFVLNKYNQPCCLTF